MARARVKKAVEIRMREEEEKTTRRSMEQGFKDYLRSRPDQKQPSMTDRMLSMLLANKKDTDNRRMETVAEKTTIHEYI